MNCVYNPQHYGIMRKAEDTEEDVGQQRGKEEIGIKQRREEKGKEKKAMEPIATGESKNKKSKGRRKKNK